MARPRRMTAETLHIAKGYNSSSALQFVAQYDASAVAAAPGGRIPAGAVLRLTTAGKYALGVGNDKVMPLIAWHASDALDVAEVDGGDPSTEAGVYVGVTPTGNATAYPVSGSYEFVSTAFDPDEEDNFVPNVPLTAPKTGDTAGLLTPGTLHTNMIVGIVSQGVVDNGYGAKALAFWSHPVFPH
jgi:hypothetical protein